MNIRPLALQSPLDTRPRPNTIILYRKISYLAKSLCEIWHHLHTLAPKLRIFVCKRATFCTFYAFLIPFRSIYCSFSSKHTYTTLYRPQKELCPLIRGDPGAVQAFPGLGHDPGAVTVVLGHPSTLSRGPGTSLDTGLAPRDLPWPRV